MAVQIKGFSFLLHFFFYPLLYRVSERWEKWNEMLLLVILYFFCCTRINSEKRLGFCEPCRTLNTLTRVVDKSQAFSFEVNSDLFMADLSSNIANLDVCILRGPKNWVQLVVTTRTSGCLIKTTCDHLATAALI